MGIHCPVCDKRFAEDDDIVVCPICGAPHHRECYQKLGSCALSELHIKGQEWQPAGAPADGEPQESTSTAERVCAACGAQNPPDGLFCKSCGAQLSGAQRENAPSGGFSGLGGNLFTAGNGVKNDLASAFGGLKPTEEISGVSARDLALFVGENSAYFLPRWKVLSTRRAGFSINFGALFFNFAYFFYRKMYLVGGLLLALIALTQLPAIFIAPEYVEWFMANFSDISIGITPVFDPKNNLWAYQVIPYIRIVMLWVDVIVAGFANRIYLSHALSSVRKIKAGLSAADGSLDDRLYTEALAQKGHTSRVAVIVVLAVSFAVYFGVCIVIAASAV